MNLTKSPEPRSIDARAPWAEPVLVTAAELLLLADDYWHYELVEGRLVRMAPTGESHSLVLTSLVLVVARYVEAQRLGTVRTGEPGFWLSPKAAPDTVLAPDMAFIAAGRRTTVVPDFPRLAPDLVAEVASPSQKKTQMGVKAHRYLEAGVRLVWIVYPEKKEVEVWRADQPVRTLTTVDELSGEDVLPGFVLPIAELFADLT